MLILWISVSCLNKDSNYKVVIKTKNISKKTSCLIIRCNWLKRIASSFSLEVMEHINREQL